VLEDLLELVVLHLHVHRAPNLEAQVGPSEARDRHVRRAHPELPDDVAAHLLRGGRGERQNGRAAEPLRYRPEHQVVRAKVVPPLTHAVRLVHDEQAHLAREQPLEEFSILEALRSQVQDLSLPLHHPLVRLARFGSGEVRVHGQRIHPLRGELVLLVLHQRDERTHDDRQPGQQESGKLIDDRLSTPRRHDHQRVTSR
jgi:hypothetical protein